MKDALKEAGVAGLTVAEIKGFGRQGGHTEIVPGLGVPGRLRAQGPPRGAGRRRATPSASSTLIADAARTGQIGDGKIWVTSVERVVRIRTGERDADAL